MWGLWKFFSFFLKSPIRLEILSIREQLTWLTLFWCDNCQFWVFSDLHDWVFKQTRLKNIFSSKSIIMYKKVYDAWLVYVWFCQNNIAYFVEAEKFLGPHTIRKYYGWNTYVQKNNENSVSFRKARQFFLTTLSISIFNAKPISQIKQLICCATLKTLFNPVWHPLVA